MHRSGFWILFTMATKMHLYSDLDLNLHFDLDSSAHKCERHRHVSVEKMEKQNDEIGWSCI